MSVMAQRSPEALPDESVCVRSEVCSAHTPRGWFVLRPVNIDLDLDVLHGWMNQPHVAEYWRQAWPRDKLRRYLVRRAGSPSSQLCLGLLDGLPVSYWEIYRAIDDVVGTVYSVEPDDVGVHLLIGEPHLTGAGLGTVLLGAVKNWLLDGSLGRVGGGEYSCRRVVAEPDVRNVRSIRAFEKAGFRGLCEVTLPDKTAALMAAERAK